MQYLIQKSTTMIDVDVSVGAVSNTLNINVNILERDEVNLAKIIKIFILQARI